MRQVFLEKGVLAIKEVCQPELDDHSVLVAVSYSFLASGLGLNKAIKAQQKNLFSNFSSKALKLYQILKTNGLKYAKGLVSEKIHGQVMPIGHSCSGMIIAVGKKVKNFRVGDYVACIGTGFAHHADVVNIPEKLAVLINESNLKAASLIGLGSIAVHAIRKSKISLGDSVIVVGSDPLSSLIKLVAEKSGANVAQFEKDLHKKSISKDKVFNNIKKAILETFNNSVNVYGIDCLIVSPQSLESIDFQEIIKYIRTQGKIIIVGEYGFNIPNNLFYEKEIEIVFALSYGPGKFDPNYEFNSIDYPYSYVRWTENRNMEYFIDLINKGLLEKSNLLDYEYQLSDLSFVFEKIVSEEILGTVIKYDNKIVNLKKESKTALAPIVSLGRNDKHSVSLYGLNDSIKNNILPIFEQINNLELKEIIDSDVSKVLNTVKNFKNVLPVNGGFQQCIESSSEIILISPNAKISLKEVLTLAEHGKTIALSRPVCRNIDELYNFEQFINRNPHVLIVAGYGRTFSPFMRKVKSLARKRKTPIMINYRINVEGLSPVERVNPEWSCGRVFSDASHILDLFLDLIDSKPVSISAESIKPNNIDLFPSDNFTFQICFVDGSIASFSLSSIGSVDSGYERMEVNFDKSTIICDDFIDLKGYGVNNSFHESSRRPDFGYFDLFNDFFDGLIETPRRIPVTYERMLMVEKLSIIIDNLIFMGGGEELIN